MSEAIIYILQYIVCYINNMYEPNIGSKPRFLVQLTQLEQVTKIIPCNVTQHQQRVTKNYFCENNAPGLCVTYTHMSCNQYMYCDWMLLTDIAWFGVEVECPPLRFGQLGSEFNYMLCSESNYLLCSESATEQHGGHSI